MKKIYRDFKEAVKNKYLKYILLLAVFFIFPFISRVDITGDGAVYSTRAIGKLDFMFADQQSTPLQWFDKMPWWAHLSYHDMPPVVLFIQHIFLSIHESIFFAKLPFALMGLGSIIFTYLWVNKIYSERLALMSAFFLAVNSLFIWLTRSPRLEMGVIFFCSATLYFLAKFLENKKYWYYFGISMGLLLLTKYTAFFFIPVVLLYLVIQKKEVFMWKEFYFSVAIVFLFSFVIILYNAMMYRATGHFDLQFSRLLGQNTPWHLSGVSGNFFGSLANIFFFLGKSGSYLYLASTVGGLGLALFLGKKYLLPTLSLFFLTIQSAYGGADGHFLTVYTIFTAFFVAVFWEELFERVHNGKKWWKISVGIFSVYLILFVINNHTLVKSVYPKIGLTSGIMTSNGVSSYGMYELEAYLDDLFANKGVNNRVDFYKSLKNKDSRLYEYLLSNSIQSSLSTAIIYDQNIDWFSSVWLFERKRFYHNLPIISAIEFAQLPGSIKKDIKDLYFIRTTEFANLESRNLKNDVSDQLEKKFIKNNINPVLLNRRDGQTAFKIYYSVVQ